MFVFITKLRQTKHMAFLKTHTRADYSGTQKLNKTDYS